MSKTMLILGATPVAVLVLAGCSHTTKEIVTPVPVTTAAPPTVVVANTPPAPAPRAEVRPPAPGTGYVWQDGYWAWTNGQYEWVPGHWDIARAGYNRVPQRSEFNGHGEALNGGPN